MRDYFDRPDVFGQEASKHGRRAGRDRLVAAGLVIACCVLGAFLAALLGGRAGRDRLVAAAGLVIACCVVGALLAIALLGSLRL